MVPFLGQPERTDVAPESLVQDLVFPLKCRKERTKPVRRSHRNCAPGLSNGQDKGGRYDSRREST